MQAHIRVLESSQENINSLLVGLEYLINISYVDDTEVFKVHLFVSLWFVLFSTIYAINQFYHRAGLLGLLELLSFGAV